MFVYTWNIDFGRRLLHLLNPGITPAINWRLRTNLNPAGVFPAIPLSGPLFHPLVPLYCGQRDQVGVKQRFLNKGAKSAPFSDTSSCTRSTPTQIVSPPGALNKRILFQTVLLISKNFCHRHSSNIQKLSTPTSQQNHSTFPDSTHREAPPRRPTILRRAGALPGQPLTGTKPSTKSPRSPVFSATLYSLLPVLTDLANNAHYLPAPIVRIQRDTAGPRCLVTPGNGTG